MPKVTGKMADETVKLSLIEELGKSSLPAFITGSRAYGIPEMDSDLDLVVFMTPETYETLTRFTDNVVGHGESATMDEAGMGSLKFGELNIIPVTNEAIYKAWKQGTEFLIREMPVDRKRAITVLKEFKRKALCQKSLEN